MWCNLQWYIHIHNQNLTSHLDIVHKTWNFTGRFQIWNNHDEILEHFSEHTKTPQLKFLSAILINFSGTLRMIIMIFYLFCGKFWNRQYKSLLWHIKCFILLQISLTMSESRSLVVLYGSQTGTAQEVAERVGRLESRRERMVVVIMMVLLQRGREASLLHRGRGHGRVRGQEAAHRAPGGLRGLHHWSGGGAGQYEENMEVSRTYWDL